MSHTLLRRLVRHTKHPESTDAPFRWSELRGALDVLLADDAPAADELLLELLALRGPIPLEPGRSGPHITSPTEYIRNLAAAELAARDLDAHLVPIARATFGGGSETLHHSGQALLQRRRAPGR